MSNLNSQLQNALASRGELLDVLSEQKTDCYRLFHGTIEGQPGLTIDRYGAQLFIQSFHAPLPESAQAEIETFYQSHFDILECIYNDRSAPNSRRQDQTETSAPGYCLESGHQFLVRGKHQGQDPLLFLDFRVARRWVEANSQACRVLNLFAYTCGAGVYAAAGQATQVVNLDFAKRNLKIGQINHDLNPGDVPIQMLQDDYFVVARQMAGLGINQRRGRKQNPYQKYDLEQFERVILDPPRWAKSAFGTVDLIRDYASVLKPAIMCTRPGGKLLCTNNVAKVPLNEWLDSVQRCAKKIERPVQDLEILTPDRDFPSPDGQHPLKIAILSL